MRKGFHLFLVVIAVAALALFFWREDTIPLLDAPTFMRIDSSVFHDGTPLQAAQTCDGAGVRPPLLVSDVPEGTQSLAVVVEDPDAPGGTFMHWIAWNLPPDTTSIRNDELPNSAVEGTNSAGTIGWFAPCPPSGNAHHYVFTVYALDTMLTLPAGTSYERFARDVDGHILAKGAMTGTYQR